MLGSETGHFQTVGYTAAGFFGEILQGSIGIIMRDKNGILFVKKSFNPLF
jgi:hypothetical protein